MIGGLVSTAVLSPASRRWPHKDRHCSQSLFTAASALADRALSPSMGWDLQGLVGPLANRFEQTPNSREAD